jgi:hypothetical protein
MAPRPELLQVGIGEEGGAIGARNNNYGAIQQDEIDHNVVPLTRMSLSEDSFKCKSECKSHDKIICPSSLKMKRVLTLATIIFAGTIILFVLCMSWNKEDESLRIHRPVSHDQNAGHHFDETGMNPFLLHPVRDLGMLSVDRMQTDATPSSIWSQRGEDWQPLPTNSWYLVSQM